LLKINQERKNIEGNEMKWRDGDKVFENLITFKFWWQFVALMRK
jgi:hypothetical protein